MISSRFVPTLLLTLGFAMASVAAVAPEAQANFLCQNKKKQKLKVREEACKENKETTVAVLADPLQLATVVAQVATNTSNIADNASDIAGNTGAIASNSSDIGDNTSDIGAIEALLPELAVAQNYAQGGSVNDFAGSNESILALDVTAEIPGFLMVWANVDAEHDNSPGSDANKKLSCRITVDDSNVGIAVDEQYNGGSSTVADGALAVSAVGPVTAGDHTVDLKCSRAGTGDIFINASSITTLFVSMEGPVPPL